MFLSTTALFMAKNAIKKTSFIDDEVAKGIRIFYRVRAANTNGVGPWSEAVSRVQ
jgi:hypothetical protein